MSFGWARIVSHLAPGDPFAFGYSEVFEHYGIPMERTDTFTAAELNRTHILLLCGKGKLTSHQQEVLSEWVNNGGIVIFSGGTWGAFGLIGLQEGTTSRGSGRLSHTRNDRLIPEALQPLRFFGGESARSAVADVIATVADGQAILTRRNFGRGMVIFCGVHLGQTFLQMQFGRSVEIDGIGPEDGSAHLDDGILRAEDGITLDFSTDRYLSAGHPAFATAHADALREIWFRAVLLGLEHCGQGAIFPWFWPNGAKAAGVVSLDCDDTDPVNVINVHRVLSMYGIPATWSVPLPGYDQTVYRTIRAREHEVALLYHPDAKDHALDERLRAQMSQLVRLAGEPSLSCVRPADGSWHGWNRFYESCDVAGLRMSISKGGRQPGTQGFAFGSAHPYFVPRKDGSPSFVGELPYSLYKPGTVAPDPVVDLVHEETLRRHGCMHLVATPACFGERVGLASIRRLLTNARQDGFAFFRAADVYRWEKGRRSLRLNFKNIGGELQLFINAESEMNSFTLMMVQIPARVLVNGKPVPVQTVERFGMPMAMVVFDLRAKHNVEVKLGYELGAPNYEAA
jgi:hypothetical protein